MSVGDFNLATAQIGAARSAEAQTAIEDLEGMQAVTLVATLAYGSGGTTVIAVVQTSLDGGTTWFDVARFDFAQASLSKAANLNGLLSKGVTSYAVLSAEGVFDGVLGSRLRCVITSTGTYVDTVLKVQAAVR